MKNLILFLISSLSIFTLLQVSYFLFSSSTRPKVFFSLSQLKDANFSYCEIHEPSYTQSELTKIFAPKYYSDCRTATKDSVEFSYLHIDADCEYGEPLFFVDPGEEQKLGGEEKEKVIWQKSYEFSNKSEFAFVKCGYNSIYAYAVNRFNETVAERANKIRKKLGNTGKNYNVLLLVFDSLSRFVSYNFLPKFTEFVRKPHKDFSMYEFTKIGLPEEYTLPNLAEILYGATWEDMKEMLGGWKLEPGETSSQHIQAQMEKSLWTYYSSLGYTTLFLYDTVWDYLSRLTGRDILADHVFQNFWRYAYDVYPWHDFSSKQRCMGLENSHNVSFKYITDYFVNYKDNNKFAYAHLSPSHESSGNVRTLDLDLKVFLSNLLELMRNRGEDIVIYLISDHGWKYPELILDLRYKTEVLSPMSYLLISKEVEQNMKAKDLLRYNSNQLNSRFDFNLALKYIAHYPFNFKYFNTTQNDYSSEDIYNIFTEKIRPDRKCEDFGVESHRCVCSWFEEFRIEDEDEQLISSFLKLIKTYFKSREGSCGPGEEFKVIKGKKLVVQNNNKGSITYFEMAYVVNQEVEMKALFLFCFKESLRKSYRLHEDWKRPSLGYGEGEDEVLVQLQELALRVGCGDKGCICKKK